MLEVRSQQSVVRLKRHLFTLQLTAEIQNPRPEWRFVTKSLIPTLKRLNPDLDNH